ncbi:hypothetical protein V6N13_142120 [Hibiscus sabdariffa]
MADQAIYLLRKLRDNESILAKENKSLQMQLKNCGSISFGEISNANLDVSNNVQSDLKGKVVIVVDDVVNENELKGKG